MPVYCKKIHEEYTRYTRILAGLKIVQHETVLLEEGKGSQRKYQIGKQNITFTLNSTGFIKVRQSKSLLIDYGFQVFIKDIEKPVLRFDADGATHYNNDDENLTLLEREVRTPHFHKFDKNGREYAYRTPIIDQKELDIQNSIELGMRYFCEENYIETKDGKVLRINTQQEIFPDEVTSDVHKGITFP